jgi:serine/threonine protein kinase/tetratricopeptide (TPR) repeat protein
MEAPAAQQAAVDEDLRRRFEAASMAGEPLVIDDCLPPPGSAAYRATLEELVHIELEFAWKAWAAVRQSESRTDSPPPARPPQIEQYLQRFPVLNQSEILARLVEQEFLVRERSGERPTRAEYRRRFGSRSPLGEEGETERAHLARQRTFAPFTAAERDSAAPADGTPAKRFGNYELLGEIGRGGMGVVYRARQLSAGRIVALKVIRFDSLAGPRPAERASAVERFHHEAQATARLQHEHIVTIYDVGEVAGEPFFSMRYVEGISLAEMLRSGPMESRRAAAYLESVARAVAAAHEAGILHRDLKPQNILLETRTDRALVADFGLAKLLEQPGDLTRAGDVMGTPSYMSPEQARDSSRVTVHSDVYSLGATLYHALTGRPPFQSATAVETLRQVQDDEPVPPSRLNRAVDRDLETICLTCLHKEQKRRYQSAAGLADDLRRYREGFPIQARPSGPVERTARWCRRNPLLTGALGLATAFGFAALLAASVGYATTATALVGKSRALEESERSYLQSREVVNQFFTTVSEDVLLDQPGAEPLRNELLKLALVHYQRFLAQRGSEPALLDEIARTHYRAALIKLAIGSEAAAGMDSLRQALRIQRQLAQENEPSQSLDEALSDTLNALGQAEHRTGDGSTALKLFDESRRLRQQLVQGQGDRLEYRRKLANTIMNIGLVQKQLGQIDDSLASLEQAQAGRQAALQGRTLETASAEELLLWRDLAMGHYNRANLAVSLKRTSTAEEELPPAIDVLERIARRTPNDLRIRERLAASYHLAARLWQPRENAEAARRYEQAIAALDDLHRQSPQVVEFQERLALVQMDYGTLQTRLRDPQAALAAFTSARDLLAEIVPAVDSADHSQRRRNYAVALRELARVQLQLQLPADARTQLELSRQYLEPLIKQATDEASRKSLEADLEETRRVLRQLGAA